MPARTTILRTAAVASLAAVPMLGLSAVNAGAARADQTTTVTVTAPADPAVGWPAQVCSHVQSRVDRLKRLQTRFHADAGTKGSIAFLQARIDRAKAAGHEDLARVLSDRMTVRTSIDGQLPGAIAALEDAREVCARHTTAATPS